MDAIPYHESLSWKMTPEEHYVEAENCLLQPVDQDDELAVIARALVHAMLALAPRQPNPVRLVPADKPVTRDE